MEKTLKDEMVKAARENGAKHGKVAELDFGAGAEWMYDKLVEEKIKSINSASVEICSNSVCDYCTQRNRCDQMACHATGFKGRKLRT